MEDDGITSERGPLGRGSVDAIGALVGFKYLSSAILENTRDSATGCFRGYIISRKDQNPQKPQKFCPSKISSYTVIAGYVISIDFCSFRQCCMIATHVCH